MAAEITDEFPAVSSEQVISWNPDIIVMLYHSLDNENSSDLRERMGWNQISAVSCGRVFTSIPSDIMLRPGPRMVTAVAVLHDYLYPLGENQ